MLYLMSAEQFSVGSHRFAINLSHIPLPFLLFEFGHDAGCGPSICSLKNCHVLHFEEQYCKSAGNVQILVCTCVWCGIWSLLIWSVSLPHVTDCLCYFCGTAEIYQYARCNNTQSVWWWSKCCSSCLIHRRTSCCCQSCWPSKSVWLCAYQMHWHHS